MECVMGIANELIDDIRRECGWSTEQPRPVKDLTDRATLNRLINKRQQQLDEEKALLTLLDNGIDPTDPKEWQRFKRWEREFDESITAQFGVHQAVTAIMTDARRRTGNNGQAVTPSAFAGGQP